MPNWKKLIVSGSDASLNSLNVTNNVTAQSFTGSFSGSFTAPGATTQVVYNSGGVLAANSGFVYSGSNVGIGTSSPSFKLEVAGSTKVQYLQIQDNGYGGGLPTTPEIYSPASATLAISAGGSERLRIDSSGNVGIGTSSPATKLALAGSTATTFGLSLEPAGWNSAKHRLTVPISGDASMWSFNWNGSTVDSALYAPASILLSQGTITFNTTGSANSPAPRMTINSTGNVGINTTSPSQVLEVQGQAQIGNDSVTSAGLFIARKNSNQAKSHYFLSAQESPTYQWIEGGYFTSELAGVSVANNSGKPYYEAYSPAGQYKTFGFINQQTSGSSFTSTAATASMVLYQGGNIALAPTQGNVGIGTYSPTAKLEVIGEGSGSVKMGSTGFGGDWVGISLSGTLNTTNYNLLSSATNASFYLNRPTGGDMLFRHGNSDQMIIKSGGNVGIGTTAPESKLHVAGGQLTLKGGSTTDQQILFNFAREYVQGIYNSSGHFRLQDNSLGGTVYQWDGSTFAFPNGNVGIGTTSPAYKLDVAGDVQIQSTYFLRFANEWGIQQTGTDLNFAEVGSADGRLYLKTGGNVGIGTTSPTSKLDVRGTLTVSGSGANVDIKSSTTTSTLNIYGSDTSTNFLGVGILSDNVTRWRAGMVSGRKYQIAYADGGGSFTPTAAMTIVSGSGDVGIGSTSPGFKLDVNGTVNVAAGNYYRIGSTAVAYASGNEVMYGNQGGSDYVTISTGTTEKFRITTAGNVGIGTTSPGVALDVNGSGIRIVDATNPNIYLNNGTVQWKTYLVSGGSHNFAINDAVRDVLTLGYNGAASYFQGCNVGIGTSSPSQKLDVAGAISVSGSVVDYEVAPALIGGITTTNIISFTPGTHYAAFVDYVIKDASTGANQRVGTIQVSISLAGAAAVMNEVTTIDIGNTSAITFAVSYGAPTWLTATNSGPTPYDINYMVRYF